MSPYAVLGLLTCLWYTSAQSQGDSMRKCTLSTQNSCQAVNELFGIAHINKDNDEVCKQLIRLFRCVAMHVPDCYDVIGQHHSLYHQSPYNCKITREEIIEFQDIMEANRQKQQQEVTYSPIQTSPSLNTSQSPPAQSVHIDGKMSQKRGNEGGGSENEDDDKRNSSNILNGPHLLLMLLLSLVIISS